MNQKAPKEEKELINEATESNAVRTYREKCAAAMANIDDLDGFRQSDEMVDFVFKVGRSLFDTPLDTMNTDQLIRTGGKLTGAYAYLGQKSARARAERDVYEQKADEVEKELVLEFVRGKQYKVTEAKARASAEISELQELVTLKDASKNHWENITNATSTMIMFIQSAIKVKENERYSTSRSHNNG